MVNPLANSGDTVPSLSGNGTRVPSLVWEDSTCCRAALQQEKPLQGEVHAQQLENSPCLPQLEKAHGQQQTPSTAKYELKIK